MTFFHGSCKDRLAFLPTKNLVPHPCHPRWDFDQKELDRLCISIKQLGLLQPLAVKRQGRKYVILCGERRWRAAKILGLKKLPCLVIKNKKRQPVCSFAENHVRAELSCFEEADLFLEHKRKVQDGLSEIFCVDEAYISQRLKLAMLDPRERLTAVRNGIPIKQLDALSMIDSPAVRNSFFQYILRDRPDEKTAYRLAEALKEGKDILAVKKIQKVAGLNDLKKNKKIPLKKGAISDLQFFFNTVERAVAFLEESGVNASWSKSQTESEVTVTVHICTKKEPSVI